MERTDSDIKRDFLHLLKNHTIDYAQTIRPKNQGDFFCLVDMDTDEVKEVRGLGFDQNPDQYIGKKCYQVLWNSDKPCKDCTLRSGDSRYYNVKEKSSPDGDRQYLQVQKINRNPRNNAYWELCIDITQEENAQNSLMNAVTQQKVIFSALNSFSKSENVSQALEKVLPDICKFSGAEYGFTYSLTEDEEVEVITYNNGNVLPIVANPVHWDVRGWSNVLTSDQGIFINSTEDLKESDPVSYNLLASKGLDSLYIAPVFNNNTLIGMIGLGNLKDFSGTGSVLRTLTTAMGTAVISMDLWEKSFQIQYTDPLTGYLNYEGYWQDVAKNLQKYPDRKFSLWYCDLKKFKFINDVFGYDVGDSLLKHWLDTIAKDARPGESFCRVSADNVSALRWHEDASELPKRFNRIVKSLENFPILQKNNFRPELAAGVYLIEKPEDILTVGEMMNRANLAQKSVKNIHGSNIAFYTEEMRESELLKLELTNYAPKAMKKEEFALYFQPQKAMDVDNRKINRAEVLVRWNHPTKGLLMPSKFIEIFEHNGIIVELDHYMFSHACGYIASLPKEIAKNLSLSVNVSRLTAIQPDFLSWYCQIKNQYDIPKNSIILEFTENGIIEDIDYMAEIINNLQKEGFRCAMDDFGSGQSSLNMLQKLPLNILKLDGDFFKNIQLDTRNEIIVYSILSMARRLGMETVAEGVELTKQEQQLYSMGCDYIQGYIYAKPMTEKDFTAWLREGGGSTHE